MKKKKNKLTAIFTLCPLHVLVGVAFGNLAIINMAYANIVADKNAQKNQQPIIVQSSNGTTQVNIQAASNGGVSRNKYSQFDVDNKGVILNNSRTDVNTQLGGYIAGNEHLGAGSAKIILNEVNSRDPSQLKGFIEVAGQKAQVIIANPSGITCDGCGVINANKTTLTTGQVNVKDGQIASYQVNEGNIKITGKGLDSSAQEYTDLIARSVEVNANIWANDLNVVAGRNQVSADGKQVTQLSADTSEKPQLAIDVSHLGGMYANKIHLMGTEKGVGVNNAGSLGAQAGHVTINADGTIRNSGAIQASQNIQLTSNQSVDNTKQIYSQGDLAIQAKNSINNSGSLIAQNNIQLKSDKIQSSEQSTIGAGVDAQGQLTKNGQISAQAKEIQLQGKNQSAKDIILTAQQIDLSQSQTYALGNIYSTADKINFSQNQTYAKGNINLTAQQIDLNQSETYAVGAINLAANKVNNQNANLQSHQQIIINADNIDNSYAKFTADKEIQLTAATIDNRFSALNTQGLLTLTATTVDNSQARSSSKQLNIHTDFLNSNSAQIMADLVTINAIQWQNQNATIVATDKLTVEAQHIDNKDATLLAGSIDIKADALSGNGNIFSDGNLYLTLNQHFTNEKQIKANGDLTIESAQGITNANLIQAANQLTLKSDSLINHKLAEISASSIRILNTIMTNYGVLDGGHVVIKSDTLNNLASGKIFADRLAIQSKTLNNLAENGIAPVIAARTRLDLGVETLNNKAHALIISAGALKMGGELDENFLATGKAKEINNHSARIEAADDMQITVKTLNNFNDNINVEIVKVGEREVVEYSPLGSTERYILDETVEVYGTSGRHNYNHLKAKDGSFDTYQFYEYIYTEAIYETRITHSEPAEIVAGRNIIINADTVNNTNSQVMAGNVLSINANDINNNSIKGTRIVKQNGTVIYYDRKKVSSGIGGSKYQQDKIPADYLPADEITSINLQNARLEQHQTVSKTVVERDDLPAIEIELPNGQLIGTLDPNITLPESSLYIVNKTPQGDYLIETDPRFTQYKAWLSSDYMLEQIKNKPENSQKRLGDGYYEQQLIKQQIAQLTGQRYLGDYQNDLQQYQALMNAGVEFANQFNLSIGVALTAEQMQQLTSDIVWLVSKTVMVDDQPVDVLVPQVYVVNQPQVSTEGALLTGKNVVLDAANTIQSGGSILAQEHAQLLSRDITNSGTVAGDNVYLKASQDIQHSGAILAQSAATLSAGNNINIISASNSSEKQNGQAQQAKTVIASTATIQVSKGDLTIAAGNDVNLAAAQLSQQGADGKTVIMAGNDINLSAVTTRNKEQAITNASNYRKSDETKAVGTTIIGAGDITLQAKRHINAQAATVSSDKTLTLQAENITITTAEERTQLVEHHKISSGGFLNKNKREQHNELDSITQKESALTGNNVVMSANNDLTIKGSYVGAEESINLQAGGDVTIGSVDEGYSWLESVKQKTNKFVQMSSKNKDQAVEVVTSKGSEIEGNHVNIQSGNSINMHGSYISGTESVALQAAKNITIAAAEERFSSNSEASQSKLGLMSSGKSLTLGISLEKEKETETAKEFRASSINSSEGTISIHAGEALNVAGSNIIAKQDVAISANEITITTTENEQHNTYAKTAVNAGLTQDDLFSFTLGGSKEQLKNSDSAVNHQGSNIGSLEGSVNIHAKEALTIKGSEVIAGQDIALSGESVNITAATDVIDSQSYYKKQQAGLSVGLSGAAVSAVNAGRDLHKASKEDDDMLQALQGVKAGLSGAQAAQEYQKDALTEASENSALIKLSVSAGASKTESKSEFHQESIKSSNIAAGNNLTITATGRESSTHGNSGDIIISGSQIEAGNDLTLTADRDLIMQGEANRQKVDNEDSSSGLNVGVQLGIGGDVLTAFANANYAKSSEHGNGTEWVESVASAGNKLTVITGGDAVLTGAQLKGEQVVADIGGNLTMTSQQDSDLYDYDSISVSGSGSGGIGGSASVAFNKTDIDSDYTSVVDQTGIYAGEDGFDITVGKHTQLNGSVIASEAGAERNSLDTGTLGWQDIQNQAKYSVEQISISAGTTAVAPPVVIHVKEEVNSTTHAAVEVGTIIIRDEDNQQQDISELSRDTENATNALDVIFDKEKEFNRIEAGQLISEISGQVINIFKTDAEINAIKAANAAVNAGLDNYLNDSQTVDSAKKALEAAGQSADDTAVKQYIAGQLFDTAYQASYEKQMEQFGAGSNFHTALSAVTGVLQAAITGNVGGALTAASAPYLAGAIKEATKGNTDADLVANIILHGVLGAVNGSAQGGNALAGAAGAITAEGAAHLVMSQLYPGKTVADLSNEERMNISAISTAIAGLAGGLVADSSMGVGTGASAGKNAVENNYLNSSDHQEKTELEHAQKQTQLTEEQEKQLNEFKIKDEVTTDALITACSDIGSDSCKAERQKAYDEMETYQNLTYAHPKEHQAGYQEIKGLLQAISPEGDLMRQIYDGYKNGYIGLGYSQEEAGVMAGRTIGTQLILNGVSGTIGLDALNKLWSTSKVSGSAGKGTISNKLSHLTLEQQQLIKNAENISTAKPGKQVTVPRDLNEQIVWKQVQDSPASGEKLIGMNNDSRFPMDAGFQKMQATHKLPDSSSITIHYQYNSNTGKAYDMKIDSVKPEWPQPGVSIRDK